MTVNVFTLEMANSYFPTESKPQSTIVYTDEVLQAYYKCFTTGFETNHSITECVAEDDVFRASVNSLDLVVSTGCLIKTTETARVLRIDRRDGRCVLYLDKQVTPGTITVCGLGYIPVSVDTSSRSFTVRDVKFGNEMKFRLNFRDSVSATNKREQPFVTLTVLDREIWLMPHSSYGYDVSANTYRIATYSAFRSFVSNGSFLWYAVKINSTDNTAGISNMGYCFAGWIDRSVFLAPSSTYTSSHHFAGTMDTYDGVTNWNNSNMGRCQYLGLFDQNIIPYVVKPWVSAPHMGGGFESWRPAFSTQLKGLGSAYHFFGSNMIKLPGMQYAPVVSYNAPTSLFNYGEKLIWTGEAFDAGIPRYFSIDEQDWEQ